MHRALVHFAAVCISDPGTGHHRSDRRSGDENNERQNDPVKDPRETFSNWQRRRIQSCELRRLRFSVATALCVVNDIRLKAI